MFSKGNPKHIVLASNPCVLQLDNGLTIGVTSTDIVRHTEQSFVQPSKAQADRIKNICSSIIAERSFYPLRPTHESVCLHVKKADQLLFPGFTPDLLVFPSVLKTFAYTLPLPNSTSCTCVNPGKIVVGRVVGSYMSIMADPVTHKITRVATMQL